MARNESFVEEVDRKVIRHKRRVRNQIISYVVLAVFLIGLVIGGIFGIRKVMSAIKDKKHAEELQRQLEELSEAESETPVVEAPQEEPEPVGEQDYLAEIVEDWIGGMTLEDKVAGLFMITPEALTDTGTVIKAGDTTKEKLGERPVGGLIYSSKNIKDADQLTEMLQNTKGWSKYPIFLGIEEEGGKVSPVADAGLAENAGGIAQIGEAGDAAAAQEAGAVIGSYLAGLGFNLDLAPVADVLAAENTTIGERAFGSDPNLVSPMVSAMTEGLQASGVSACLKYFPGLGGSAEDPHEGMASTEKTLEELSATDFPAYQAGIDAGADFIMVTHLSAPNVLEDGDTTPASLSAKMVTEILRGQLGYQGIIVTDAMDMAAITDYFTPDEAAVKALQAGVDMVMMPEDYDTAYMGVLEAVNNGTLPEERINESLRRIFKVKCKGTVGDYVPEQQGDAEGSLEGGGEVSPQEDPESGVAGGEEGDTESSPEE